MIRNFQFDDIENIYKIGSLVNNNFALLNNMENIIDNKNKDLFVYVIDEEVVGFVLVNKLFDEIEITHICVVKKHRRNGYAKSLINYLINSYKCKILLEVNINNISAIKLYENLNFKVINRRLKYYNNEDDCFVMERKINE